MNLVSLWNSSNQAPARSRLRRLLLNVHLCIGLGVAVLLVPISLSGAVLVWHDQLDALINPGRYAVTQGAAQPPSALLASARSSLGAGFEPTAVRLPEDAGSPATVTAREQRRGENRGRPRLVTVYLDPPTARVLATVEFRDSLFGFLHRFHENLTVPEWSGRAVVGWTGVAMLVMSLSGIYLWWPRNAVVRPRLALPARPRDLVQPASSVRILDRNPARRGVGDRHLSWLSAAGPRVAFVGRADDAIAARRLQCSAACFSAARRRPRDGGSASPAWLAARASAIFLPSQADRRMARPGARRGRRCHCAGRRPQRNARAR